MSRPPPTESRGRPLLPIALVLLVFGERLMALRLAGSPLPYYDQWLAEFNNTFLLAAANRGWSALFVPHNEHILFTTKLASLAGFMANGYWDVTFLSVCSAAVRGLTAGWTWRLLADGARPRIQAAIWLLCAAIFLLPFSPYNWLNGMQISFYFADLCLLWSIHATLKWRTSAGGAAALVVATLTGILSVGSAVALPAASLAAHLVHRRERRGFWPAWVSSAAIAAAYAVYVAHRTAVEEPISTQPPAVIGRFFLEMLSWPGANALAGVALAALVVGVLRARGARQPAVAAAAALAAYAAANALLIAIRRPPAELHMRHWEVLALLPLGVVAAALHVSATRFFAAAVVVLVMCYGVFSARLLASTALPYWRTARATRGAALAHYREILLSGPRLQAEETRVNDLLRRGDRAFFDDPIDRFALHPIVARNLRESTPAAQALLSPDILPARPASLLSRAVATLRDQGWIFLVAGLAVAAAGARRLFAIPAAKDHA